MTPDEVEAIGAQVMRLIGEVAELTEHPEIEPFAQRALAALEVIFERVGEIDEALDRGEPIPLLPPREGRPRRPTTDDLRLRVVEYARSIPDEPPCPVCDDRHEVGGCQGYIGDEP